MRKRTKKIIISIIQILILVLGPILFLEMYIDVQQLFYRNNATILVISTGASKSISYFLFVIFTVILINFISGIKWLYSTRNRIFTMMACCLIIIYEFTCVNVVSYNSIDIKNIFNTKTYSWSDIDKISTFASVAHGKHSKLNGKYNLFFKDGNYINLWERTDFVDAYDNIEAIAVKINIPIFHYKISENTKTYIDAHYKENNEKIYRILGLN